MLFHDSKDESAWGLALAGLIVVTMAALLGEVTGAVQPTAPLEMEHTDVSSPYLRQPLAKQPTRAEAPSPYPQPTK